MKNDFKPYKIGTVFNPLLSKPLKLNSKDSVEILFPSRLNAMAIDPSKITTNENMVFTPGEVTFSVKIYTHIKVSINNSKDPLVLVNFERESLAKHAFLIMKKALNFNTPLKIEFIEGVKLKHAGLGSSSALISAIGTAINELFGNPLSNDVLAKYLAQNHGEEIEGSKTHINPVQCIGGSAISGMNEGSVFVIAGESCLIGSSTLDKDYTAVIGIPKDYVPLDSKIALEKEIEYFPRFLETGRKYGQVIAYEMLHKCLPALKNNNIKPLGELIFDYRFKMGSIENCSFLYPDLPNLAKKLSFLIEENIIDVLAISSVGPAFFAITKSAKKCSEIFEDNNFTVYISELENNKYTVLQ